MASALASAYPKVRSWISTATSPSTTHASGMLIILGILAAVTDAQPDSDSSSDAYDHETYHDAFSKPAAPVKDDSKSQQEMLYYIAMGMLVSQGLIRLITFISNRREAAATAARKKDDDLAASEKRKADLKTLADASAPLLGSDTEDDDYEAESESESESEEEEEEEEDVEESEVDSESETEIQRRRRVLAAGDAEVEE
ncbi:hypothetical protein BGZ95_010791 [Linnemannia exigua]|uniref:Uncharacterized protein n=1 Tax=Linnemannia exigua TaxID=604196 RepID=A0AAD4H5R0_9FUNG|nr:hypothetical protein BGZ95_010791 [Linnemannia exigua]